MTFQKHFNDISIVIERSLKGHSIVIEMSPAFPWHFHDISFFHTHYFLCQVRSDRAIAPLDTSERGAMTIRLQQHAKSKHGRIQKIQSTIAGQEQTDPETPTFASANCRPPKCKNTACWQKMVASTMHYCMLWQNSERAICIRPMLINNWNLWFHRMPTLLQYQKWIWQWLCARAQTRANTTWTIGGCRHIRTVCQVKIT